MFLWINSKFGTRRVTPIDDITYMTNNNTNKGKAMLTEKETEGMTLEQFAQAIREGKVEVRPEGSHEPTADQVTMNGRFGCE